MGATRSTKTFKKLYDKIKHLKCCTFYTDSWDAFSKALPKESYIIGKQKTVTIEQDNSSSIRNNLARFTRRTRVVSKPLDITFYSLYLSYFDRLISYIFFGSAKNFIRAFLKKSLDLSK